MVVANNPSSNGSGGGGSTGYNVYNYDLTTPQFTPDGLLKQVEYACAAPTNSMPMIIVPISLPPTDSNNDNTIDNPTEYALIIATISAPSPNENDYDNTKDTTNLLNHHINKHQHRSTTGKNTNGRRGQSRIIEIPIPSSTTNGGSSVIVGLNGILSDSVALLQTARQSVQSHHSRYGIHRGAASGFGGFGGAVSVASAKRVAESIANRCQEHSFGGGMRPFGVSMVVCGLDGNCVGGGGGRMIVCVTDPSGGVSSYRWGAGDSRSINGDEEDEHETLDLTDVIIIGGEEKTKAMLRRQLFKRLRSSSGTSSNVDINTTTVVREGDSADRYAHILRQSIRATVEALAHLPTTTTDSGNQRLNTNGGRFQEKRTTTVDPTLPNTIAADDIDADNNKYDKVTEQMDLIIMTSRAGVQRLSKAQILDLMMSMPTT